MIGKCLVITNATTTFEDECKDVVGSLRAALIELYDSVGADPLSPQDVARRFGLNKTLTWNIARMIQAPSGVEAVPHVPGIASIEKIIKATSRHGASKAIATNVRAAAKAFDQMVEVHVGDRATLELITDCIASGSEDRLELSRKLAFRGNSGLYGVQAKTRLTCHFAAPGVDDPTRLDLVSVHGYIGFRRLRTNVTWPLFKARRWSENADSSMTRQWDPIGEPNPEFPDPKLLNNFTRGRIPEMHAVENTEGRDIVLLPGAIGNHGAFDCFRGEQKRSVVSAYRTEHDDIGEFGATITSPCENLILDLIVHKDLGWLLEPEMFMYGRIVGHGVPTITDSEESLLPIKKKVTAIPGSPPSVATPQVSRYSELIASVIDAMGWDGEDFRGVRLELKYPPLASHVVLRSNLPEAP